ncbi:hypothetical protein ACFWBH_20555 [Streptomyces sp. NPDC059999]|uniref:hypothetical protein n=1 Tax=Streptomyces sp. NPDC059999 TaxID=3347030 RepID=UPI0036A838DF
MLWNRRRDEGTSQAGPSEEGTAGGGGFLVEEYDRVLLLRQPSDELLGPQEIADLVRCAETDEPGTVTVVAGADEKSAPALWPRLGDLLDWVRDEGATAVRLVMSGSGDGRPGENPAVAQRIADAWEFEVVAPDGTVLCVPGGGLFVHGPPGGEGGGERGWWRFRPGVAPVPLGPRQPVPVWRPVRLPSRTRGGRVVEEIPAGVLIRSGDGPAPRPGDLCYAVPMDGQGPLLVLGVPDGEDVDTEDVSDVVASLPDEARAALRVAPGGRRDVLHAGQAAADLVGAGVVVYSGLPLIVDAGPGPGPEETVRSMVVGRDGAPRWQPFVDSVLCAPGAPEPSLLRWSPPLPDREPAEHGVVHLSDRWQVSVSRAGLLIGARDDGPQPLAARPVDADGPAIEVGRPGEELDTSLWPALSELLDGLEPDLRTRARLHVHGKALDGGRELRRLAALHGVRSVRFATFGRPAEGGARLGPGGALRAEPATGASTAVAGPIVPTTAGPPVAAPTGSTTGTAVPALQVRRPAGQTRGADPEPTRPGPSPSASASLGSVASPSPGAVPPARPEPFPATGSAPFPATGSGPLPVTGSAPLPAAGPVHGAEAGPTGPPTAPRPLVTATVTTTATLPDPGAGSSGDGSRAPESAPAPGAAPAAAASGGPAVAAAGPSAPDGVVPASASARVRSPETPAAAVPRTGTGRSPETPAGVAPPTGPSPAPPVAPPPFPPATPSGARPAPDPGPATPPLAGLESAPAGPPASTPDPQPDPQSDPQPDPRPGPTPERAVPSAGPASVRPSAPPRGLLPPVPVLPEHHSTEAERTAFRTLADTAWERHAAAVARTLTRLPALRGAEQVAARADLVALLLYLGPPDGPFGHRELDRALRAGGGRLLPYAACVASALRRLPSFRGAALRGAPPGTGLGTPDGADAALPRPGTVLREPAAVSALPCGGTGPEIGSARFAIWSVTGRRVRQLFGAAGSSAAHDEIVFAPGTAFRVLDVRGDGPDPLVLLRQLSTPATAPPPARYAEPDAEDQAVLARLDEALRGRTAAPAGFVWPERCAGPLGGAGPDTD